MDEVVARPGKRPDQVTSDPGSRKAKTPRRWWPACATSKAAASPCAPLPSTCRDAYRKAIRPGLRRQGRCRAPTPTTSSHWPTRPSTRLRRTMMRKLRETGRKQLLKGTRFLLLLERLENLNVVAPWNTSCQLMEINEPLYSGLTSSRRRSATAWNTPRLSGRQCLPGCLETRQACMSFRPTSFISRRPSSPATLSPASPRPARAVLQTPHLNRTRSKDSTTRFWVLKRRAYAFQMTHGLGGKLNLYFIHEDLRAT